MSLRHQLLSDIAGTMTDYREGEIPRPTPDHVECWLCQFEQEVQLPLLQELNYVLKQTYFNRKTVETFLRLLLKNKNLVGSSPRDFWKQANFHKHQRAGHSQQDMLRLFDGLLRDEFGFGVADCGSPYGSTIYLDDALFSGSRVVHDLQCWLEQEAADRVRIDVIVIATHTYGEYSVGKRLEKEAARLGKDIDVVFWRTRAFENRRSYRNAAQVLWPADLPDDDGLAAYMALEQEYPFQPRTAGKHPLVDPFCSEYGRQLLEREFLLAGIRIRSWYRNPSPVLRPLGFSNFGLGFGSTIVTYRNCPNNCPLALWFGDPSGKNPWLRRWYPLFPRKTYE